MASSSRKYVSTSYHQLFWKYGSHAKVSQQKDKCIGNFLEAALYIVFAVQNVKIFTTLNDSSFESNCLLFAQMPSPGYPKQISPYFILK